MYRSKAFVVIIFFLVVRQGLAQEEMNSTVVENRSYQLYLEKKWDALIPFGLKAIREGYEYFYLCQRLGIAYYEKGQFRLASIQLEKALDFNSFNELTQEYCYYSLIFSNRFDEARKLSESFGERLSTKINKPSWSPVDFVSAEGGLKISSRSDLFNPGFYFQAGLGHTVKNRFSLYHAATVYNQSESRGKISQVQYFIQAGIPLGRQWTLTPSVHLVYLNFKKNNGLLRSTDLVGSLSLTRAFPYFDVSIGGTVSDVLSTLQYIQQSRLAIYPSGKPNFSLGAISYIHSEDNFISSTLALNPFVYWSPGSKVKLYANYFVNKNENIVELNGYLINNSHDLTLSRTSVTLSLSLNTHWDVYGNYQFESKQQSNSLTYSYNVFLMGIKFKP